MQAFGTNTQHVRLILWIQSLLQQYRLAQHACMHHAALGSREEPDATTLAYKCIRLFGDAIMRPITTGPLDSGNDASLTAQKDSLDRHSALPYQQDGPLMQRLSTAVGQLVSLQPDATHIHLTAPQLAVWHADTLAEALVHRPRHVHQLPLSLLTRPRTAKNWAPLSQYLWLWPHRHTAWGRLVGHAIDTTLTAWVLSHTPQDDAWIRKPLEHLLRSWIENGCGVLGLWQPGAHANLYPIVFAARHHRHTPTPGLSAHCRNVLDAATHPPTRVRSLVARLQPLLHSAQDPSTQETLRGTAHASASLDGSVKAARRHALLVQRSLGLPHDTPPCLVSVDQLDTSNGHPRPFTRLDESLRAITGLPYTEPPRLPPWFPDGPLRKAPLYERGAVHTLTSWLAHDHLHKGATQPEHVYAVEEMLRHWCAHGCGIIGATGSHTAPQLVMLYR